MGNLIEGKKVPELRFPGFTGEWEGKKLGEEFEFIKNYSYSRNDEGEGNYYHIHYGDIHSKYNSYIDADTKLPSIKNLDEHITLDEFDIILADASEDYKDLGKATLLKKKSNRNIIAGLHTFALRIKNTKNIDAKYFLYYTKTDKYRKYMSKVGTGTSVFGINKKNLEETIIPLGHIYEQEKIGSFFYTLDQKLDLQKKRIEELKDYKKGMMQRIFDQEIRFKDENGQDYPDWEEKKLGEVFEESTLKLKDIKESERYTELLSVTLYEGIKKQIELGDSDVSSIDKSNYKIVNKNDIVYNSMRMWQGASGVSQHDGIVSSAYVVLRPKKTIRSDFMARYFKDLKSIHKFYERSQGMTSDTLTLRYNLFKDILLTIPSLPEQEKIASFLSAIDRRIELEEERLESYEEFKKGLMQRMFV